VHLYFSIDRTGGGYWAFSAAEAIEAHLSFVQAVDSTSFRDRVFKNTVNPLVYIQQHLNDTLVATKDATGTPVGGISSLPRLTMQEVAAKRRAARIAAAATVAAANPQPAVAVADVPTTTVQEASLPEPESVASVIVGTNTDVDHLEIQHAGTFTHSWQKVNIEALNKN